MRKLVLLLSCGFIVFMCAAWVDGQPGGGKGGKGGIFGRLQQTPVTLLNLTEVKEELKLTDAQLEELPAEYLKAIEKVLKPDQLKRFKQIELQTRGNNAFKDRAVQKALKFTEDQTKSINSLLEGSDKEIAELTPKFGGGGKGKGGGDFKGAFEKIQNVQKETKEKILTALTKDQRKQWREMTGEEFKIQQGGFGFGGGSKKKGADKNDN
jgi:hypothetical protein